MSPESKEAQAFRQGLRDADNIAGRDGVIEWRYANGDYDRVPELVADLVQTKPEVIVVDNTVATQAVKRVTSTIPIVMASVADPVGSEPSRQPRTSWWEHHRALDDDGRARHEAAATLTITIPESILLRADEVIQ